MTDIQIFNSGQIEEIRPIEAQTKDTYKGYVYGCECGSLVKIGSTNSPYTTMKNLAHQAKDYGDKTTGRFVLSPSCTNYRECKKELLRHFAALRIESTDLFNIPLADVATAMEGLAFKDETEKINKETRIFMNGMKNFVTGKTDTIVFEEEQPRDIVNISNVNGYLDKNGNIWLCAEDVAIGFGFTQEKNGVTYVKWERVNAYLKEFGYSPLVGKGSYIPESMVYRLGFKANNSVAVKFQTVLAEEVLPSIRKHGFYATEATVESMLNDPENAILMLQAYQKERKERLAAQQQVEKLEAQAAEDKPKVIYADAVKGSTSSCLIGELAKMIAQNGHPIGEKRLFQWMRDNHYLCSYGERFNQPYQQYIEQGLFTLKQNVFSMNGEMKVRNTTKVTGKGQIYFINKFLNI